MKKQILSVEELKKIKNDLLSRKQLQKLTQKEIKDAYKDLWEYHADIIKQAGYKKYELAHILDTEMNGWEDVCFFVGYIRGLENIYKLLNK